MPNPNSRRDRQKLEDYIADILDAIDSAEDQVERLVSENYHTEAEDLRRLADAHRQMIGACVDAIKVQPSSDQVPYRVRVLAKRVLDRVAYAIGLIENPEAHEWND